MRILSGFLRIGSRLIRRPASIRNLMRFDSIAYLYISTEISIVPTAQKTSILVEPSIFMHIMSVSAISAYCQTMDLNLSETQNKKSTR